MSRRNLCRVFKFCCLVVRKVLVDYPAVDRSLNGCIVPLIGVTSCIRGVQSCVSAPGYKHIAFFTKHSMVGVRKAIADAR